MHLKGQTGVDQGKVLTQRVESLDLELGGFRPMFLVLVSGCVFLFSLSVSGLCHPPIMFIQDAHDGQTSRLAEESPAGVCTVLKSPVGAHVADPMLEGYGVFTQGKTPVYNFVEADYQTVTSGQVDSPAGDHTRTHLADVQLPSTVQTDTVVRYQRSQGHWVCMRPQPAQDPRVVTATSNGQG